MRLQIWFHAPESIECLSYIAIGNENLVQVHRDCFFFRFVVVFRLIPLLVRLLIFGFNCFLSLLLLLPILFLCCFRIVYFLLYRFLVQSSSSENLFFGTNGAFDAFQPIEMAGNGREHYLVGCLVVVNIMRSVDQIDTTQRKLVTCPPSDPFLRISFRQHNDRFLVAMPLCRVDEVW